MTQARPPAASWRDNLYVQYYFQQPPVTRTLLAGVAAVSLPPLLYLIKPVMLVNFWDYTLRGEIWRPLTALLYGGGGMELLFGVFFAYQYSLQLETIKFGDSTADYAYYLLFSWLNLMVRSSMLFFSAA
jgi:Derlin-2/3